MRRLSIYIFTIFLVCCYGCSNDIPAVTETIVPSELALSTDTPTIQFAATESSEPSEVVLLKNTLTLKPATTKVTPAEVHIPTTTSTRRPSSTFTYTPVPTETPDQTQVALDFSKYGPLAYIDGRTDKMTIRMITADGRLIDWNFESELIIWYLAWSPDGKSFALATDQGINLLSISNNQLRNLPETREYRIIFNPSFSPDGNYITFFGYNEGSIYRINIDGTGLMNLTPDSGYRKSSEHPAWMASGDQILFSRPFVDGQLYRMNADGTNPQKLTQTGSNQQPRCSPDGKWLAFLRRSGGKRYLYAMPASGGKARPITFDTSDVLFFSWSPDGRYLVFIDWNGDYLSSWIIEFKTGRKWELIPPRLAFHGLEWSPLMVTAPARDDCTDGWTRLKIGGLSQLIGRLPNRVRSEPQLGDNVIGQFIEDQSYALLDGPVCADGLVWWEIADPRLSGGSGWTAEGDLAAYYLEPVKP